MDDDEHEIGCECWTCELDRRACAAEDAADCAAEMERELASDE